MSTGNPDGLAAVTIDPENPWLGLFSYSEETRAYFHGRDEETAELARRVQRKLLTVLFGQSGLGKTSLLRAGIVPRLRDEGYCPVYVRIDYAPNSPSPTEQIKQAILKAAAAAGAWTRPGSAIEGESLWEFMHHRGDLLCDADGRTLLPLLIFDQFEEIFTLAQADDIGRMRATKFLEDLADLAENRPPAALEARLELDDNAAEDFDFARADYRILIALREDYLAHLEGVKNIMPSITQNRMRLARMTGAQALSAVVKPGGRLVTQEVAESIVRFVAGGAELANAEIEPSLLSLVCRELNSVRLAQGRTEISADLLAGSRETILTEFYERALADQPAGVRRVIEDELLTESGYRESLAEERVIKALVAEGADPEALATLVDRRLLRIEERLDMRRVELTHDVLCSVVLSSRDLRHEREARDQAERRLAEQKEREAASHKALVRARMIAGVCAILMVLAAASAVFGWINLGRARVADAEAQKSRALAEKARGDAEKLVGFLIEDFYVELEPTGRLETLGKLAHKTIEYYDGLPAELITPQNQTYRAMALVREGSAKASSGDVVGADKDFKEAQAVFEKLRAAGNKDQSVTLGLGLALYRQGDSFIGNGRGKPAQLAEAADLLRPLVYGPNPSREVRQTYADILNVYSHSQPLKDGVASCEEARKILVGLGALDLSDLNATTAYADTSDSQARHELSLGRYEAAQKLEQEVYELTEKAILQRPGDLRAMADRYYAASLLATLAEYRFDDAVAAEYSNRAIQAAEDYVRFNPSDLNTWANWVNALRYAEGRQVDLGEISLSLVTNSAAVALAKDKRLPSSLGPTLASTWFQRALTAQELGQTAVSEQALRMATASRDEYIATLTADDPRKVLYTETNAVLQGRLELIRGNAQAALTTDTATMGRLMSISFTGDDADNAFTRDNLLRGVLSNATQAALVLGRYQQAESFARQRLALQPNPNGTENPLEEPSLAKSDIAYAVAMQGRGDEARALLAPGLDYYRRNQKMGAHGLNFRFNLAYALYVSAISRGDGADTLDKRNAEFAEAAQLIAGATAEARGLSDMRRLSDWIAAARAAPRS